MTFKNSVIVELSVGGHHATYLRHIIEGGFDGFLLLSEELWSILPEEVRNKCNSQVNLVGRITHERERQIETVEEFLKKNPEITECFFLSIAEVFRPLLLQLLKNGWSRTTRVKISGLWNVDDSFERRSKSFRDCLKWWRLKCVLTGLLFSRSLFKVLFLNEEFCIALRKALIIKNRVSWCPEPLTFTLKDRIQQSEARVGPPRILLMGYHSSRKGTAWALECIGHINKPIHVIVAGPQIDEVEIKKQLLALPQNITVTVDSRILAPDEMQDYLQNCDLVCLPYREFGGSSSIMLQAVQCGKQVLGTDFGMMGRQIKELKCGKTFKEHDKNDFLKKVTDLLSNPITFDRNKIDFFLHKRTPVNFYRVVVSTLSPT